jgi:hypothetical protein
MDQKSAEIVLQFLKKEEEEEEWGQEMYSGNLHLLRKRK